jgi:diguanylate cyclase (GGDEF)-like protein
MTALMWHGPPFAHGAAREAEGSARCGEPAAGAPPRAWMRAVQGTALSVGAPLGWLLLRMAAGHAPGVEVAASASLYLYMLLGTAVMFTAFGAALGKHEDCLIAANRALDELSVSDPVTGLRNARYFRERLREAQAHAQRSGQPLSIVVMDLDRFKRVNDRYGHPVGDEVLVAVSAAMTGVIRAGDTAAAVRGTAARMGGEEFALLLPDTDPSEAWAIAERVRRAVREAVVHTAEGEEVRITISCGVASGHPVDEAAAQALYAAADQAMYAAKHAGRDRTRLHGEAAGEHAYA